VSVVPGSTGGARACSPTTSGSPRCRTLWERLLARLTRHGSLRQTNSGPAQREPAGPPRPADSRGGAGRQR
jgi:hypothetical protein